MKGKPEVQIDWSKAPEDFAPLLTAEQKQAREISDIQAVLQGADDDLDCARRLVAAGYRKVEGGAQ